MNEDSQAITESLNMESQTELIDPTSQTGVIFFDQVLSVTEGTNPATLIEYCQTVLVSFLNLPLYAIDGNQITMAHILAVLIGFWLAKKCLSLPYLMIKGFFGFFLERGYEKRRRRTQGAPSIDVKAPKKTSKKESLNKDSEEEDRVIPMLGGSTGKSVLDPHGAI